MGQFKTELVVRLLSDGCWVIESDLVYIDRYYGYIIVKKGFITYLARFPKFLRDIVNSHKSYIREPAIMHDAIYSNEYSAICTYSRRDADKIFYSGLRANGVSWLKAKIMYGFVRLFCKTTWKKR